MKRFIESAAMVLLILSLSVPAFSQVGFFASVTGTVTDSSKALIPGVTVKATAVDTNIVTTTVTNEAGSYNFNNLNPGKYTISASLPGFQTKNVTDAQLSQNASYRYNFELSVSGVNTQVEVSISADTILSTSGATIGQVLSAQKVQELPLVGNNVLDLITVMAGVENIVPTNPPSAGNAFGRENTTFAGVSAQNVAIVRDGIQVQDNRNPNGIYSVTTLNPDLIGEIRLILAPVDVELGRGNGAISYSTRSGTNLFSGSAVWSFRNTAFDPNTWSNNRNQGVPVGSPAGTVPVALRPTWVNVHQGTISFGGPIIRNKTFFFALYDMNEVRQRSLDNFAVPTPCARLGIYRYFNNWNNGNIFANVNLTTATAAKPTVAVDGTPINGPAGAVAANARPDGTTAGYDASLQYASVFGPLATKPTKADCSDAAINTATLVPNGVSVTAAPGAGGGWDAYRRQLDTTGFISRTMAFYPTPNNYETGDGLNTAGFRYLRKFTGTDNLFGSGEATGARQQINVKIDHNFTSNHKANVNVTYERIDSDDVFAALPGMFSNQNFRRPIVVSSGFTSTLSSSLLNEVRFGIRKNGVNVVAPWDRPEYDEDLAKYFPADVAGFRIIPQLTANIGGTFCYPHSGARPPNPNGCGGGNLTATSKETTPTYTFADTLSWTRGAHAFKFGAELRLNSSQAETSAGNFFGNPTYVKPTGGSVPGNTVQGSSSPTDIAAANPAMAGILNGNATNARTLANFLAGSINNMTALYFLTSPNDTSKWSDFRDSELLTTKLVQREFDAFVKDDYKLTKDLTLNLGVRWDYYGVPYVASGLTVAAIGGGASAFGISGRDFTGWMNPGARSAVTNFEFVGPNSPNPGKTVYPNDYNNFSPGVGFAWQVPWFGEGKTTVRGGYQVTYQGGGRFGTLQGPLAVPPGSTLDPATPNWTNVYKDLSSVASSLPIVPSVLPMQPIGLDRRTASFTAFDPKYVSPYVQNLTMNVTRSVSQNLTLDVRYVGTLSRKNYTTLNLNTPNFLYNGLLDALNRVRTGTEITKTATDPKSLLDQMFNNINMCPSGCTAGQSYGAIGTTVNGVYQSAAYQMRSSPTFQTSLANGYFGAVPQGAPFGTTAVATAISNFNYSQAGGANAGLPAIAAGTVGGALRANGFAENYVSTNPQFAAMNYFNNSGYSNYHSLQVQASIRPIQGFSGQATYTYSKNLGLPPTLTDPTSRAADYTNINGNPGHTLRTNGTIELPIGPNKLLMGNSSGWLARAVERWNLGLIYNLSSGAPLSIDATSMLYANGTADIVYPVDFNAIKGVRWGTQQGVNLEGRYLDTNNMFVKVDDPQCATVTSLQGLNNVVGGVQTRCSLDALAMAVPAGTAGAVDRLFTDNVTRPSVIVLQHPTPGKRGTLGRNTILGLGSYRFDASLGKTFRISESKSLQVRLESQNVLNHPQPSNSATTNTQPNLSITDGNYFGRISTKNGARLIQGQLRFSF